MSTELKTQAAEQNILFAARKIFILKGYSGARMQEIANEAQINKALLHYYFRNKETLFEQIFRQALQDIIPQLNKTFLSEGDFFSKMRAFIHQYIDLLHSNPYLPAFIINELNSQSQNSKHILQHFINPIKNTIIPLLQSSFNEARKNGLIRDIDTDQAIVSILSMCVMPLVGRPLFEELLFEGNPALYQSFLNKQKKCIFELAVKLIS